MPRRRAEGDELETCTISREEDARRHPRVLRSQSDRPSSRPAERFPIRQVVVAAQYPPACAVVRASGGPEARTGGAVQHMQSPGLPWARSGGAPLARHRPGPTPRNLRIHFRLKQHRCAPLPGSYSSQAWWLTFSRDVVLTDGSGKHTTSAKTLRGARQQCPLTRNPNTNPQH